MADYELRVAASAERTLARLPEFAAVAVVEQHPLMEGRQMVMMFAPKKK